MPSSTPDERTLVLPDVTLPSVGATVRRHRPTGRYRTFRGCLRWEFGFTCSICLVHEADLTEHGVQGTGLTSIEHRHTRSSGRGVDDYNNCLYVCRFCNGARGKKPLVDQRRRALLDPTLEAWQDHFSASEDQLLPRLGSANAEYTRDAYSINCERRVLMRRNRREQLGLARSLIARRNQISELLDAGSVSDARELSRLVRLAESLFTRFRLVPTDAPSACTCGVERGCMLPDGVRNQGCPMPDNNRATFADAQ